MNEKLFFEKISVSETLNLFFVKRISLRRNKNVKRLLEFVNYYNKIYKTFSKQQFECNFKLIIHLMIY